MKLLIEEKDKIMKPLHDRVLIKLDKKETTSESGIILTNAIEDNHSNQGEVVDIGEKVNDVKKGDRVIFKQFMSDGVKQLTVGKQDDSFVFVKEEDILCVVT